MLGFDGMNTRIFALATLGLFPFAADAAIYKCQVDDNIAYSEHPCAGLGQEFTVAPPPQSAVEVQESGGIDYGAVNDGINTRLAARSTKCEISKLGAKVRKAKKAINGCRAQMDRGLSIWRPPGQHAAIRGYWDSKASDLEREIAGYHQKIDKLNGQFGSRSGPQNN